MAKDVFLYQQLYEMLRDELVAGKYPPGTRLPSEDELRRAHEVSVITIKKALGMLADEGFVQRIPGRGTFAQTPPPHPEARQEPGSAEAPKLLGAVLEHVSSPFGLDMMYYMDRMAEKAGYKLIIRFSYGNRDKETAEIDFLMSQQVQGLIIMPSHGKHYSPAILKLYLDGFPVIMVDKKLWGIPVASVRTNNASATARLVHSLYEDGCRHIALVTSHDLEAVSTKERQQGYEQAMAQLGLEQMDTCLITSNADYMDPIPSEEALEAVRHYWQAHPGIDGLVCAEYGLTPAITLALAPLGVVPDRDVRLCVIDEDILAPYGYSFAHMKQDEKAIATLAMDLLLRQIHGERLPEEDYLVPALFAPRPIGLPTPALP